MKHNSQIATRGLGPGTKVMLIGILAFAAYSFATRPEPSERRYYEADASGRLRLVDRPATSSAALPKLWKPEPAFLSSHGDRLSLTEVQRSKLDSIEKQWLAEKASLEGAIQKVRDRFDSQSKRASMAALQLDLREYSQLSRTYEAARNHAWRSSCALLTPSQVVELEALRKEVLQ